MGRFGCLLAMMGLGLATACGGGGKSGNPANPGLPPPTTSIAGIVQFKGAPLAGATVTAFLTNTNTFVQTTASAADGSYRFTGLQCASNSPQDYQVWVRMDGYGFYPFVGSGGKTTRADYTGQFQGNGITDPALYFTVIDYVSSASAPLTGADFTAYDGSNPGVSLARTGQSLSFAPGDDASEARGVAWPGVRFTAHPDGTVTDALTGLVWLKNAGALSPGIWADALAEVNQLASGTAGLSDGSKAGDWRLPNLNELESLIDASTCNPALPAGHPFTNVSNGLYWSSTSYFGGVGGSPNAWALRLSDGRTMNDSATNLKSTASNGVWAVKGGTGGGGAVQLQATGAYVALAPGDDGSVQSGVPLTYPRWIDNHDGTTTDTVTGLVWLKQADAIQRTWPEAVAAVKALASGQCGLSDGSAPGRWRMPNRNEMQSLSDRAQNNHADFYDGNYLKWDGTLYQAPIFNNLVVSQYYWTSTTDAADPSRAWTVYSCDFGVYDMPKTDLGYTLAVR